MIGVAVDVPSAKESMQAEEGQLVLTSQPTEMSKMFHIAWLQDPAVGIWQQLPVSGDMQNEILKSRRNRKYRKRRKHQDHFSLDSESDSPDSCALEPSKACGRQDDSIGAACGCETGDAADSGGCGDESSEDRWQDPKIIPLLAQFTDAASDSEGTWSGCQSLEFSDLDAARRDRMREESLQATAALRPLLMERELASNTPAIGNAPQPGLCTVCKIGIPATIWCAHCVTYMCSTCDIEAHSWRGGGCVSA